MRFGPLHRALALPVVLLAGFACSSGSGPRPVVPTTITITSGDIVLDAIGETAAITAVVLDRYGREIPSAVLSFMSADPAVATVSGTGVVTAVGDGATFITVRSSGLRADVPVSVELGDAGTVTIRKSVQSWFGGTPDNPVNPPLSGFEFAIRPAAGGEIVATGITDAAGVARINAPPGTFVVTESDNLGLTDVTADVPVTVVAGEAVFVNWVNRQAALTNEPIAIIEASPRAVPEGDAGQTEVRLYAGNSADPNDDALSYFWQAPGGTFIGSQTGVFARVTYPGGTTRTITLTVDDGTGNVDIDQVQITGTPQLPAAGNLNIELVPIEPITDGDAQAAFDLAEATWESIIRNDLPDVGLNLTAAQAGRCFDGAPAINETIDDVRIYIEFSEIDGPGGVFASAGPCYVRDLPGVPNTPIIGVMRFDSADFENQSAAVLNRVILHEMAHVLGFGTLWNRFGLLENISCPDRDNDGRGDCTANDPPGPDTRFTGEDGSEAYRALGGELNANVPVENGEGVSAGPGSRDGHWREVLFGTELMTGFIQSNVTNPLSIITAASFADMGYLVDFSQVDNYSIPGSPPFPAAFLRAGDVGVVDLREDVRAGPIFGIGPDGAVGPFGGGR